MWRPVRASTGYRPEVRRGRGSGVKIGPKVPYPPGIYIIVASTGTGHHRLRSPVGHRSMLTQSASLPAPVDGFGHIDWRKRAGGRRRRDNNRSTTRWFQ
jgi:hypothetical protein